jgi:hypothetical protein
MALDLYAEKLSWFKQNERPEVVLLLADNPDSEKIVVAWMNLDIKQAGTLSGFPGESEREVWEWLWSNASYNILELKEQIGTSLTEKALKNKLKPLIGNRIIYPDGTVNSYVQRYLREKVVKLFETKTRKSVKTR